MAKSKNCNAKKQSYISVPSQIINSLSSSSLQSLLVSPKKKNSNRFFSSYNLCRSPRVWLFALFLFGFVGILRLGWNVNTLIPFSPNPCLQTQSKPHLAFVSNIGKVAKKDDFLIANNSGQPPHHSHSESEFWKQPDGMGYRPCLDFSAEYRRASEAILKDRSKYLLVVVSGGMNQQRNQIVDAVVIARILGAALVVPILQVNVIWGDESEFSDIFDLAHFKRVLVDDVRILSSLPSTHIMTRPAEENRTPLHVSPQWIRAHYLKRFLKQFHLNFWGH